MDLLASGVALTTTPTASTYTSKVSGNTVHTIMLYWTPGTANNVLTVTIEHRGINNAEDLTWIPHMNWGTSAGDRTRTLEVFKHTAASTALVPLYIASKYLEDLATGEIRIKYSESEAGSSTKGTISAYILSTKA